MVAIRSCLNHRGILFELRCINIMLNVVCPWITFCKIEITTNKFFVKASASPKSFLLFPRILLEREGNSG